MKDGKYKAIDLFAGIGGMRIGFEKAGFEIIYSNDIDRQACITYRANFGDIEEKDIREVDPNGLLNFDVLLAGFPCQPFSAIGKRDGLNDPRGQLFNEVVRFLNAKRPRAFVLENVKNLLKHEKKQTYLFIKSILEKAGNGYKIYEKLLNSKDFGVPQKRERVYIVGISNPHKDFKFPSPTPKNKVVADILEENVPEKYYLSEKYYTGLLKHRDRHLAKGSGFGCEILDPQGISNTLVCGNMGRERNLIQDKPVQSNRWGIRKLTTRECARLQGFPDSFKIPVPQTQAYKQFGNAVSVPVAHKIAVSLRKYFEEQEGL